MAQPDIVLAFSGGLDTSFCVPWLIDQGFRVTTLFVDTGGVSDDERDFIEQRAVDLGAHCHLTHDAAPELWATFVVPLIKAGAAYQGQYPLLCSDRYVIAKHMTELAEELGTSYVAHGCTAAGNDQFRFDQSIQSLGDFQIIAPVREIQSLTDALRPYEEQYLAERGFEVRARTAQYTINENCLGVTVSGSEIDDFIAPSAATHVLTAPPAEWPDQPVSVTIGFREGVAVSRDGTAVPGPELLASLNRTFGAYGVGRGIYTGDTTIGLKGRIVFECPGLEVLRVAHRALEEAVLTKHQNGFKPSVAKRWVELVYEGFFFEPLRADLEAFIDSSQQYVTGDVTITTHGGSCFAAAIDSPSILQPRDAVYAQSAPWTKEAAEGFIRLYGQSSILASTRERGEGVTSPETVPCTI